MASAISSVTRAPIRCTPSTGPSLAATSFTIPPCPYIMPRAPPVEGEAVGDDLVAGVAGLPLGEPDAGHLGRAVGDPGDARVVDRGRGQPRRQLRDLHALGE